MEFECSWWHAFEELGKVDRTDDKRVLFPNVGSTFNVSKEAMILFWLELGFMKRHGGTLRVDIKACESFKEMLTDHRSLEASSTRTQGKVKHCVELGRTSLIPQDSWKKHQDDPRRTLPPTGTTSRESTTTMKNEVTKIVSNSEKHKKVMRNHAQLKLQHSKSALVPSSSHQKIASSRSCTAIVTKRKYGDCDSGNEASTQALPFLPKALA